MGRHTRMSRDEVHVLGQRERVFSIFVILPDRHIKLDGRRVCLNLGESACIGERRDNLQCGCRMQRVERRSQVEGLHLNTNGWWPRLVLVLIWNDKVGRENRVRIGTSQHGGFSFYGELAPDPGLLARLPNVFFRGGQRLYRPRTSLVVDLPGMSSTSILTQPSSRS